MMKLTVIILAAGKGKRMASDLPKVMHTLAGTPILEHVIRTAQQLNPEKICVVYGSGGRVVRDAFSHYDVEWVEQSEQLGTGHAVRQALPHCVDDKSQILILYGDVPLISVTTLKKLLVQTPTDGLGVLVAQVKNPAGLGRIIRDDNRRIIEIIEHADATPLQRQIQEINTGIMTCKAYLLKKWLAQLKPHNQQQEYYLTDIVGFAVKEATPLGDSSAESETEIQGVNDLWQLAQLERAFQLEFAKKLTSLGVKIMDPSRLDVRGSVHIERDVILDINVILEGKVSIGKNCKIGANCYLKDVEMGENVTIHSHTILDGVKVASYVEVGPFARIRPGTILEEKSKVGNFVEMKKTILGQHSKANHLTYLGDTLIEANVNIGAGTITCNYDGVNKWSTIIKSGAFIGSNVSLVAPITVGMNATVGAGSTVTAKIPDNLLTIARSRQVIVPGWKRPTKEASTNGNEEVSDTQ